MWPHWESLPGWWEGLADALFFYLRGFYSIHLSVALEMNSNVLIREDTAARTDNFIASAFLSIEIGYFSSLDLSTFQWLACPSKWSVCTHWQLYTRIFYFINGGERAAKCKSLLDTFGNDEDIYLWKSQIEFRTRLNSETEKKNIY